MSAPSPDSCVHYSILPSNPAAHRLEVCCTLADPDPAGQRFALPAWIPGSYLVRDFARHVLAIRAESGGRPVGLRKIDKHTWQADALPSGAEITVISEVYAWDLSVRAAHVDSTHAFFNGSSVFLRAIGREDWPCRVDIRRPHGPQYDAWRVATALAPACGEAGAAAHHGFGRYRADNYEELIDHPVEIGSFTVATFTACGVAHEVVISGRHDCDVRRLCADVQRICEWQLRFFGEPPPVQRYLFLLTVVGEAYGGLEHRASTALLCARDQLPYRGMRGIGARYCSLLGLFSHEYFHTWLVKRIRPTAFCSYDLERENYTTLLWAFEGFTSYYDDLTLLRSGLITRKHWLQLLARTVDKVARTPGRHRQTLAESSFDAWIKFYRPDENTPNAVVDYYAKGSLAALALDLHLRAATGGRTSLDDVLRALWQRCRAAPAGVVVGVGDEDIRLLSEELSGLDLKAFFAAAVHGTDDLPLAELLGRFGIRLECRAESEAPVLGVETKVAGGGCGDVVLATVYDDGPAQKAGLAAGDVLIAIDGLRASASTLAGLLSRRKAGEWIEVLAFRRDEVLRCTVQLAPAPRGKHTLCPEQKSNVLREAWLQCGKVRRSAVGGRLYLGVR